MELTEVRAMIGNTWHGKGGLFFVVGVLILFGLTGLAYPQIKIMPLGDSITNGEDGASDLAGYRSRLAALLDAEGVQYDFVGSLSTPTGAGFDNDHEGHNGFTADEIRDNLNTYLSNNPPDIILLHIGTNDISGSQGVESTKNEIEQILDSINTFNPNIKVILATIVPRGDAKDSDTDDLNRKLEQLYLAKRDLGRKIFFAGINQAFKCDPNFAANLLSDNVHPNDTGYQLMAEVWFNLIMNALTFNDITITDNFERQNLGDLWVSDPENVIQNGDLVNTGTVEDWLYLSVYKGVTNASKVSMVWSNTSDAVGVELSGLALMLDKCDPSASGYGVTVRASLNEIRLWPITNGTLVGPPIDEQSYTLPDPGPGDVLRVAMSSDGSGNRFEVFINDQSYGVLTDGNAGTPPANQYAGIIFFGNQNNDIEDFAIEGGVDLQPPSQVVDLTLSDPSHTSARASWTAPGGDGNSGTATAYDLRYATTNIVTEDDFNNATPVPNAPTPSPAGTPESMIVLDLQPSTTYFFALRAEDAAGNKSAISNVATVTTEPGELALDDFNRGTLGTDWDHQGVYAIVNNELANTSVNPDKWDLAIYKPKFNPVEVSFKWSPNADAAGIDLGGIALMLDSPNSAEANGYLITRRTAKNEYRLWQIVNGGNPANNVKFTPTLPAPQPGDEFRIVISSDETGNHFTVYINGVQDVTLTDPAPTFIDPNAVTALYAGVQLAGNLNNNIDDFKLVLKPVDMQIVAGNNQVGTVGQRLPQPITVKVIDGTGAPLANADVLFTVTAGNGTLSDPSGSVVLEAEDGTLTGGMVAMEDAGASQGQYIEVPNDQGVGTGLATYQFEVPSTGTYYIVGRAETPDPVAQNDAFKVIMDGGMEYTWDVSQRAGFPDWDWDYVSHRGSGSASSPEVDPVPFELTAGTHTLQIKEGKDGTRLDQLLITTNPNLTLSGAVSVGSELTVQTDANGEASALWTLGPVSGLDNNMVTASFLGQISVGFTASANPDVPASIAKLAGDNQQAEPGAQLPLDLLVQLKDRFGNLVSNYETNWTVITGNGSLSKPNPVLTDANAQASNQLTTATDGPLTQVQVTAPGYTGPPVVFNAQATAGPANQLQLASDHGNNQTGTAGKPLARPFKVQVVDQVGVAVIGHPVVFTVTGGGGNLGGSATKTVNTDGNGFASATLTLGPNPGAANTVEVAAFFANSSDHLNGSPITFTANAANPLTLQAVSPLTHSGTVSLPLANNIQVRVLDALGQALPGYAVTFTVTLGGGRVNGSTEPITVTTNSQGIAEVTWSLGPIAGSSNNQLQASAKNLQGQPLNGSPITFTASAQVGAAARLIKVSGDSLSGLIQNPLTKPFVVRVEDTSGNPVVGWPVDFTVTAGGGNFGGNTTITKTTGSDGTASATLTLGSTAATPQNPFNNRAQVSAQNNGPLNGSPITFVASAIATGARNLSLVSGANQTGPAGLTLPNALQAKITDDTGINPIADHPVRFQITAGGGWFANSASIDTVVNTDQNGVASLAWTLGGALGTNAQSVTITSNDGVNPLNGSPLVVFASATTGPVDPDASFLTSDLSSVPADGQSKATITVTLTDRFGNPVAGKAVILRSSGSNNIFDQPLNTTDANGRAVGTMASTRAELKQVSARNVSDAMDLNAFVNVTFTALNPSKIQMSSGDGQTANVGTALENPLEVLVTDVNNNPVSGVPVNFDVSGNSGFILSDGAATKTGSGQGAVTVITDASGKAQAMWVLGPNPGPNTAQASASFSGNDLAGSPIVFSATGVTPTPAAMLEHSGNSQTGPAGLPLAQPFAVRIVDASGRPVAFETVNFRVQTGGGTLSDENPVTDHLGIARSTLTLGTVVGTNTVVASHATGSVTFTAEGVTGLPANLKAQSPQEGSGTVNSLYTIAILVTDRHGNPFEGAHAAFDVLDGSASIESHDSVTDVFGIARAQVRLPTQMGRVVVKATSPELPGFFELFEVDVLPGPATTIAEHGGNNQQGTVGRELVFPLEVRVTDQFGNPVSGFEVQWVRTIGNGSMASVSSLSGEDGVAANIFILGTQPGLNEARAVTALNPSQIIFQATGVTNRFPLFVGLHDTTVTEGQTLTLRVAATDDDGDPITYEAQNLPSGASFSGDTFSWTPTSQQAGEHAVTFIARDNRGGLDSETIVVTVRKVNNAPVITAFSPAQLRFDSFHGKTIDFSVSASDPDGDGLSFTWLLFTDPTTNGTLVSTNSFYQFISDNFDAGTYIIQVRVSDGQDETTVTWRINLIVTSVELVSFSAEFTDFDGVKVSWITSRETNNLGFNVLRGLSPNGDFEAVNDELIESKGLGEYTFFDRGVQAGQRYYYQLEDVDINGERTRHGPIQVEIAAPETFELSQNFPNPFNPETKIRFQLPRAERVVIRIVDVLGREVRRLVDDRKPAGFHEVVWDARDDRGLKVGSGVYYYQIQAGEFRQTKKMLLLK